MNDSQISMPYCEESSNLQEIEIFYKNRIKLSEMPKVSCSVDVNRYLRSIWGDHISRIEEFRILCLNRANRILGFARISSGGLSGTVADPRVIFQIALKSNATGIILAHNHPSGNREPSEADRNLTRKLKEAGILLDINVLDHLILTNEDYYSFADEGIL